MSNEKSIKDDGRTLQVPAKELAELTLIAKMQNIALMLASAELQKHAEEIGGCDHPVGICCCELYKLIDSMGDLEARYKVFNE